MYFIFRLIRLGLVVLLGYFLYKILWKGDKLNFFKSFKKKKSHPQQTIAEMKKDPVCGTYIPENQAVRHKDYYFCSPECKEKFLTLGPPPPGKEQPAPDKEGKETVL